MQRNYIICSCINFVQLIKIILLTFTRHKMEINNIGLSNIIMLKHSTFNHNIPY